MKSALDFESKVQGVLDLHEFWARNKFVQAKFVLVKLCTISLVKLSASEILKPNSSGQYFKLYRGIVGSSNILL